jgi:hypothetical protein
MGVLTIEGEDEGADVKLEVRLGVFVCAPKSTSIDDCTTIEYLFCGIHAPMILSGCYEIFRKT